MNNDDTNAKGRINKLLVIILAIALLYIGYLQYKNMMNDSYNLGVNDGANKLLIAIYQQSLLCQPIPLSMNNQTINIIAMECLKQEQHPST